MTWALHLPILIFLALGLLLRVMTIRFEGQHLKYAWDFLAQPGDEEERNGKRETLFERIGVALRAARLGRVASLLILAPSLFFLLEALLGGGDFFALSLGIQVFWLFLVAIVLAMVVATIQAFFLRGFYLPRGGKRRREAKARWLSEAGKPIPAPVAAAALMWDWILRVGELVLRKFELERPKAYFLEREDELLMAIGEFELRAFGLKKEEALAGEDGDRSERAMIRAIQRLDDTLVREVMRPLNKVTSIYLPNFTAERFLNAARRTGYTRFPCYYDQLTNLIGYLNVHDFLDSPVLPKDIRKYIHQPVYIPEVARVDAALQEMLRRKLQVAICFDEFGGCSGLLSREDIIEEITGEVMDEYDRPEELKWIPRKNDYLVDASIDLDDLAESIGLDLEKKNCDTLAGYIYHRLSRVPRRGEVLEEQGWRMEIIHMDKHRIQKVRLLPPAEEEGQRHSSGERPRPTSTMLW